ncbi:TPA: FRG domain-containing protein [Photobacterium damselae]
MKQHREWYSKKITNKDELHDFIKKIVGISQSDSCQYMFRGQADSDWMIGTSFQRIFGHRFDFPNIQNFDELTTFLDSAQDFGDYHHFHDKLIAEFTYTCVKDAGLVIANPRKPALLDANYYLSLAQHYQVPTNLIDFTYSPLIALFFAFDYSEDMDFNSDFVSVYQTDPIRWVNVVHHNACLSTHSYDECMKEMNILASEYDYKSQNLAFPRLSDDIYKYNHRIKNQNGAFYFLDSAYPYDLMMYRMKERSNSQETRYLIDRNLKSEVIRLLTHEGITNDYIYPPKEIDPIQIKLKECRDKVVNKYL